MSSTETINILYRVSEQEPFSFIDNYNQIYAADNDNDIIYNGMKIIVPTGKEVWLIDILLAFQERGIGCSYNCWASVGEDLFIYLPAVSSVVPIHSDRHATLIIVPSGAPPYIPVCQSKLYNQLSKRSIYSKNHYDQSLVSKSSGSNNSSITSALKGIKVPKLSFKKFEKFYSSKSNNSDNSSHQDKANITSNSSHSTNNDTKRVSNSINKVSKPERPERTNTSSSSTRVKDNNFNSGSNAGDTYSDRPSRDTYSDRPSRDTYSDRPSRDAYSDRPSRDTYSDRPSRDAYSDRPSRDTYSDRPSRDNYSDRPSRDSDRDRYNNSSYNSRDQGPSSSSSSTYKQDDMAAIADTAVSAAKSLFSFAKTMVDATAQAATVASANLGITTGNIVIGQTLSVGQSRVTVVKLLAEGGFGSVFLATDASSSSTSYALKQVLCQSREQIQDAQAELRALKDCSGHPNIISLIDHAQFNTASAPHSSSNSQVLYLFPLCSRGTAWDSIEKSQEGRPWPFTEFRALNMIMGVAKGLHFMHSKNMAHSDVKPHNILINNSDKPVIMDLGSVTTAKRQINTRKDALNVEDLAASKTSAAYRSPELTSTPHPCILDGRVDIWGLGATMYCLAFGTSPFESSAEGIKKLAILNGRYSYPSGRRMRDCIFSEAFTCLIDSMLHIDITKRPFADEVEERCLALLKELK